MNYKKTMNINYFSNSFFLFSFSDAVVQFYVSNLGDSVSSLDELSSNRVKFRKMLLIPAGGGGVCEKILNREIEITIL